MMNDELNVRKYELNNMNTTLYKYIEIIMRHIIDIIKRMFISTMNK